MLTTFTTVIGQKNHWLLYPNHLDFSSGTIVSNPVSFSLPLPYDVENSIYSEDGDLLVYFQNGELIDPANPPSSTPGSSPTTKETGIFPLPGTCNSYCAINLNPTPSADLYLVMQEFEVNGSGIQELGYGYYQESNQDFNFYGGSGGIAISKVISGTNANRNIYIISYSGVHIFLIDETGFHRVEYIPIQDFAFNGEQLTFDYIAEAELSPDGNWLAWNAENFAIAMNLSDYTNYNVLELQQRTDFDFIKGLEFSAASDFLYISMRHLGVKKWDHVGPDNGVGISGSWWLDNTQLELGKDGNIYGVTYMEYNPFNDGELQRIMPNGTIQGTGITVFSDGSQNAPQYGFALPDQIDGEDEFLFHGVQPIELPPLSFNGTTLASDVSGTVPEFYNCMPIVLDDWGSGEIDDYDISITSVNPNTGEPIYGNNYLNYQESFSEQPDADIRCLRSSYCSLFNKHLGQTFKIIYTIGNACDAHTEEGFFQVFAGATPANTTLDVNIGNGNVCPSAETIEDVCLVSLYGASIDLSQSQGDIDYYQLTFTEVDCMTGDVTGEGVFYEGSQMPVGDIGTVNALNLNTIEIDGITGYFIAHHFQNRCIRIDAMVGNECGGTSKHAYIRFLTSGFLSRPDSEDGLDARIGKMGSLATSNDIMTYPNPVKDKWMISWSNTRLQTSNLVIYDQMGRSVYQRQITEKNPYYYEEIDMSDFTAGLYYYQLVVGNEMTSGKLIKL